VLLPCVVEKKRNTFYKLLRFIALVLAVYKPTARDTGAEERRAGTKGEGCRVSGLGFRVQGLRYWSRGGEGRDEGLEVWGLGFRV
jgi:hypothetical protein